MEMSNRGKEFIAIAEAAEKDFRELLNVPENYKVLFLQGGATLQFGMVPMNLLGGKNSADYIYTGEWSKKAIKEANRFCEINIAASSEEHTSELQSRGHLVCRLLLVYKMICLTTEDSV